MGRRLKLRKLNALYSMIAILFCDFQGLATR
jgi:hypothetical protein